MTRIFDDYNSFTLTSKHIDKRHRNGNWGRENLNEDWRGFYEQILSKYKPSRKTKSEKFSAEHHGTKYRCQLNHSQDGWQVHLRRIITDIPSFSDLMIDSEEVMSLVRNTGLTLIVGPQDSGKSTTLVSAVTHLSPKERGRTLVLEDPCEFDHVGPFIDQREVGVDTSSFHEGVRDGYRGSYSTIVVQEIRDPETAKELVLVATSGHRVLATMHAHTPQEAIMRLCGLVGPDLAKIATGSVSGIFAQKLIRTTNPSFPAFPVYESLLADKQALQILMGGEGAWVQLQANTKRQGRSTFQSSATNAIRQGWCQREDVGIILDAAR